MLGDTTGEWEEFNPDDVKQHIYKIAGNPNLKPVEEFSEKAKNLFDDSRAEVISLLTSTLEERNDDFLSKLKSETEELKTYDASDYLNYWQPSGASITRDMTALSQGMKSPPHLKLLAEIRALQSPFHSCGELSKIAKRAASHLAKRERRFRKSQEIGTNIFIGHGRSLQWKELKDFIQDKLGLPWDEFNRIPVAGITNIARLSQMLNDAAIAFLILTAEDEQADGKIQARMNVIHEAGLFQGKLGFTRAIILLEEGCEEFSNIQGLGQIRFPKGNIKAAFQDVRDVLEREGLI